MAEIRIEKKKPLWLWIILALVIVAGIIYITMFWNDDYSEQDILPLERDTISKTGIGQVYFSMETDSTYSRA